MNSSAAIAKATAEGQFHTSVLIDLPNSDCIAEGSTEQYFPGDQEQPEEKGGFVAEEIFLVGVDFNLIDLLTVNQVSRVVDNQTIDIEELEVDVVWSFSLETGKPAIADVFIKDTTESLMPLLFQPELDAIGDLVAEQEAAA